MDDEFYYEEPDDIYENEKNMLAQEAFMDRRQAEMEALAEAGEKHYCEACGQEDTGAWHMYDEECISCLVEMLDAANTRITELEAQFAKTGKSMQEINIAPGFPFGDMREPVDLKITGGYSPGEKYWLWVEYEGGAMMSEAFPTKAEVIRAVIENRIVFVISGQF